MLFKFVLFDCRIRITLSYARKGSITVKELHWEEPFLRILEFQSWSRNSPNFMESEFSFPLPKKPATCPYAEPQQFSPYLPSHYLKIRFNIISPSNPRSSSKLFPSSLPTQIPISASPPSPKSATCPVRVILYFITQIKFVSDYGS